MSLRKIVHRCFQSRDPLEAMLKRAGVYDDIVARPDHGETILREAAARCLRCCQAEDCLDRLDHGPRRTRTPAYCCNREMIDELVKSHTAGNADVR